MRVKNGFTLIELLVAMAVGSLLMVSLVALLRTSSNGYSAVKNRIVVERESRAVFYQLEADLRSLLRSHEIRIQQHGGAWPLESLAFLCLKPELNDQNRDGDLSAVRYYTKMLTIGGRPVRCLMRGSDSGREVISALDAGALDDLLAQQNDADEPIGFGVLEFSLTIVHRDEAGHLVEGSGDVLDDCDWLVVRMVVVKPQLRARLDEDVDWIASSWIGYPSDVDQHSGLEVYTARIRMGVGDEVL